MENTTLEPCICGHLPGSHDELGCVLCDAQGQRCDGFWTQQEYADAVQSALVNIVVADKERRTDANQTNRRRE